MCDVCQRQFCPSSCPGYTGGSTAGGETSGVCELCQASIYKGEGFFSDGAVQICDECARYISVDDIKDLCGLGSEGELLERLGFERCYEESM